MTESFRATKNNEDWLKRLEPEPPSISAFIDPKFDHCRIPLPTYSDPRGDLSVIAQEGFDFAFARVFFVFGSSATTLRGNHSHKECAQLLICSSGQTCVYLESPDRNYVCVQLDSPRFCLLIPPQYWGAQYSRSADAILTVVASIPYNESDYVRSYSDWEAGLNT